MKIFVHMAGRVERVDIKYQINIKISVWWLCAMLVYYRVWRRIPELAVYLMQHSI